MSVSETPPDAQEPSLFRSMFTGDLIKKAMPLHIAFSVQYLEPKGFEEDEPEELLSSLSSPLEFEEVDEDSLPPNRDDCVTGG